MIGEAPWWARLLAAPSSVQPPVRTPRIETPPHLRHTAPPPSARLDSDDYQVTRNESLADLQRYSWGCVGLCIGGTCERCDGLADEITQLRAREAELLQQIRALEEGR